MPRCANRPGVEIGTNPGNLGTRYAVTLHVKNRVHLPPSLAALVQHRAREQHCQASSIIRDAVMAFSSLSPDVRRIHLHEFHWSDLAPSGWEAFFPDADTLKLAGAAKLGAWGRDQYVVASVAWFLMAW